MRTESSSRVFSPSTINVKTFLFTILEYKVAFLQSQSVSQLIPRVYVYRARGGGGGG